MATLTEEQKFRVVHLLATFRTPTEVQQALKEEFAGLAASLPQIMFYDPNTAQGGAQLPEKWRTIFRETRRRYIDGVTEVGIANQTYRLERLQELLGHPLVRASPGMTRATLEQAAKEVGGMFLAKIELKDLTDDQLRNALGLPAGGPQGRGGAAGADGGGG